MALLEDLNRVTNHLLVMLDEELPADEKRDAFIEELDKMLQVRDALLQRLAPPFSEDEMSLGKKVALASEHIPAKLESFLKQMKQEWSHIQQSKKTARVYGQAYSSQTIDGMYYDKRN